MGWYVKCEICGRENKYGIGCGCYLLETKKIAEEMQGCVVLESHFIVDSWTIYGLYQQLQKPSGEVVYIKISLQDGADDNREYRKIIKLTERAFYSYMSKACKPTKEEWEELENKK